MQAIDALLKAGETYQQVSGFADSIAEMLKKEGKFEISDSNNMQLIRMIIGWAEERNIGPGGFSAHQNRSEARAIATWLNSLA